jgi:DNA-binding MarR family transcriptional regulator
MKQRSAQAGAAATARYRRYVASLVLFHLAVAERCGLGATDFQALNLLQLEGPVPTSRLGIRLGLTKSAATRVVDRLVEAGYAVRQVDAADARVVQVAWSGVQPLGLDEALASVREGIARSMRGLRDEELRALERYFEDATAVYAEAAAAEPKASG